jgi:integration host factor subunit beta
VTRSDLISRIAAQNPGLPDRVAANLVETFFECISDQLAQGGRVELRGFGSFCTRTYDPKQARNPRTGERVETLETRIPRFKPARAMFERLNGPAD